MAALASLVDPDDDPRLETEREFVREHGSPAIIVRTDAGAYGFDILMRLIDGTYWTTNSAESDSSFTSIEAARGRSIEASTARRSVATAERMFVKRWRSDCLDNPGSMMDVASSTYPAAEPVACDIRSGFGLMTSYRFGDTTYGACVEGARVLYSPHSPEARFILRQERWENTCVAMAMINAMIAAGFAVPKEYGRKLYERFKKIGLVSYSGCIDFAALARADIPGIGVHGTTSSKVAALVSSGAPVLAKLAYYSGHAVAVARVDEASGTYWAVETATGVVYEDGLREHMAIPHTSGISAGLVRGRRGMPAGECAAQKHYGTPEFYAIDVRDLTIFLAWIDE